MQEYSAWAQAVFDNGVNPATPTVTDYAFNHLLTEVAAVAYERYRDAGGRIARHKIFKRADDIVLASDNEGRRVVFNEAFDAAGIPVVRGQLCTRRIYRCPSGQAYYTFG